ncbi:SRPBCC family protein [Sorangium sp. So ce269]
MNTILVDEPLHAPPEQAFRRKVNVASPERALSALGGGALLFHGLRKRGAGGLALVALGGALVARGATGRCHVYGLLGVDTARREAARPLFARGAAKPAALASGARGAIRVQRSVTIGRPREEVYSFLRDLSNLPRFMEQLKEVHELGAGRYRFFIAGAFGRLVEREVALVEDIANSRIAWRETARDRGACAGEVTLATSSFGRGTEVKVVLDVDPPSGLLGRVVTALRGGGPRAALRGDLRRLRQLLETGETATATPQPHGRRTWR